MDKKIEEAGSPLEEKEEEMVEESLPQPPPLTRNKSRPSILSRAASHLTTRSLPAPIEPPPDGGIVAWTQVLCGFLAVVNTWGFVNSFGAFQTYYTSTLPQNPSTISWIGSIQSFLMFFLGAFSGRALDAGYFRPTVMLGIALQCVGMFTMSAAKNYWQLLLTHGITTGVGGGVFFTPVMGLVATYFAKRRGMALGMVTCGNSMGGIVYPLVVRQLLPKIGFGWTVRVLGFINVVSLGAIIAFMKPRLPPRKAGPLVDTDAFRDWPYMLWVLGICFLMAPIYCVFYYIASFARDIISMPYTTSLNLVIVLNGVGIPARIIPGYIADQYLGVLNTYIFCLFIAIIMLFAWLGVHTTATLYVFVVIYGLSSAAFQSLFTPSITSLGDDITKTGTRIGMAFTVIGVSALVGGPISGALLSVDGGTYVAPRVWASCSTVVGTGVLILARGIKYGWNWRTKC